MDADFAEFLKELVADLIASGSTVATAESCTAGKVASALASIPGASNVLWGGVVAYSEEAKISLLGISPKLISEEGVVSAAVARALAEAIRDRAKTTFGIGVTGYAGPGGGTGKDPVGTVYVSVAGPGETHVDRLSISGNRSEVIVYAVQNVLQSLRGNLRSLKA